MSVSQLKQRSNDANRSGEAKAICRVQVTSSLIKCPYLNQHSLVCAFHGLHRILKVALPHSLERPTERNRHEEWKRQNYTADLSLTNKEQSCLKPLLRTHGPFKEHERWTKHLLRHLSTGLVEEADILMKEGPSKVLQDLSSRASWVTLTWVLYFLHWWSISIQMPSD